jgi:hypothetical protein
MRCLDCADLGRVAEASAVCVDCGAGVCRGHLVVGRHRHPAETSAGFEWWSRAMRCRECAHTGREREFSGPDPAAVDVSAER